MANYFATTVIGSFEEVVSRTRQALAEQGFGVITEIDVQKTLKAKLDVNFRPYLILGACNPALAHDALKLEDKVGTMLPCNVVVQQTPGGEIEIAAVDPVASMASIGNPALGAKAAVVAERLKAVIAKLHGAPAKLSA